jgi:hypothetical protein
MRSLYYKAFALGLSVALVAPQSGAAQTRSGANSLRSASKAPIAKEGVVEPAAIDALKAMSAYLMTASTLAITSQGSLDVVTSDGQRIQLDGTTQYKIRRPGFVIDYASDVKSRRFIYDGKNFTIYSPKLGFYATVAAPATNREALDTIYKEFGIALPLEDLFRWGEGASADRLKGMKSAYSVGTATIDGVQTDHYAYREATVDWEVWMQRGSQPLPRKLVIVDRTDPSRPTFIARLDWQVNPTFTDSDFAFVADGDAKRIQLASFKGMEK